MTTSTQADPSAQTSLALYRMMLTIRQCEQRLARSFQRGRVPGPCHTSVGQEAIASGVCAQLRQDDAIFSSHRGHGHVLAKGLAPRELIAEIYGRQDGCSNGRGGSMHLFKPDIGLMGTSGIVAASILQACGGGYSFKLMGSDRVAVVFFGDGAVNNGAFHEGLNMASIWKLPVLFVCENNQYATEVPFDYASGIPDVGRRAANYGFAGHEVDGNDVCRIHQVAGKAIQRAREGGGPTLIECKTYRTRVHAEGMSDFTYRSREEVEAWKARCPIKRLRKQMLQTKAADPETLDRIEREVVQVIDEAHAWSENCPFPPAEQATTHVFCEGEPGGRQRPTGADRVGPPPPGDRQITFMQATLEALGEAMARNPLTFVLGCGIGKRGGNFNTTTGLFDKYGALRLCDTPICERGFIGLGGGAAMTGTRPVVDFQFSDFLLDGAGEMINQIAKIQYMSSGRIKMPIVLRGCAGIGHSSATHHSGNYYALYAGFPGVHVVVPSTPYDAKGLLSTALNGDDPVIFLEHRELLTVKGAVPAEAYEIPFGQASVVREGDHVTVVALARMVHESLKAAEQLAQEGISVELIDPRTVAPLDMPSIVQSVARTGRLLIVDESFAPYGVGAEIAAGVADSAFDELDAPIKRLNGAFAPTPYSPSLEEVVVPQVDQIIAAVKELMDE